MIAERRCPAHMHFRKLPTERMHSGKPLTRQCRRPRPCTVDPDFALLIARPTSSSFPSTHSAWSFAGAAAIFQNHRKAGLAAFALAALIAFSRMYLFVHFPTDILAGMVLGILIGILAVRICRKAAARAENRATEK